MALHIILVNDNFTQEFECLFNFKDDDSKFIKSNKDYYVDFDDDYNMQIIVSPTLIATSWICCKMYQMDIDLKEEEKLVFFKLKYNTMIYDL